MKSTNERISLLNEIIKKAELELTKTSDSMSISFLKLQIRKSKNTLERINVQSELAKMGDSVLAIKKLARDEKRKANALLIFHKRESKLKEYAKKSFGVELRIETVGTNHLPAVPVKS